MMDEKDMTMDCIKYCLIKARTHNDKDALDKIAKALSHCDGSKQSIRDCIMLLKVLEDEG
jgi:hypothetical protein